MNGNLTDITVVLDRSGSMVDVVKDVVGGFNTFVEQQKQAKGSATFTLIQFDNEYEFVHKAIDIQKVPKLEFQPRGSTAILDAMGKAIVETGERLKNMAECDRPSKVIFVIITDGQENASKEYRKSQITEMIKLQREVYSWEFVFMSSSLDAVADAHDYGILRNSTTFYSPKMSTEAFHVMSCNMASMRGGQCADMGFSEKDRSSVVDNNQPK